MSTPCATRAADDEALNWCRKAETAFAGKLQAAIAIFTEARIYIAREDWQNALDNLRRLEPFGDLGGASVPGGTNKDEVAFLTAYCLEQQGIYPAAIDKYLSIPDGRDSYYGWRADERLKLMAAPDALSVLSQKLASAQGDLKSPNAEAKRRAAIAVLRLANDAGKQQRAMLILQDDLGKLAQEPAATQVASNVGNRLLTLGLYDEAARRSKSPDR